jgi:hypothetical protein
MKTEIITALFDIGRDKIGDGRTMQDYLEWFETTLKLNTTMTIFIEEEFFSFVNERRNPENTQIIIQKLEEVPFYNWKNKIEEIITSENYKSKMADIKRIECINPLYNVIQYSKFGWIKNAIELNKFDSDYFMWMDAGCSRFFDDVNILNPWPNVNKINIDKFLIGGNQNTFRFFPNLNIDKYIWDNNCTLAGGLFGGGKYLMLDVYEKIMSIFKEHMIDNGCVNNEQFALSIMLKKYPEIFNVLMILNGSHLPLFKFLS